jgi:competence protein ComGC
LIELLIVVAIIAILAMIAVPNFLEAQTRAKVSRVQTDMRSLATALEAYFVDWNTYPVWFSDVGTNRAVDGTYISSCGHGWWALTTPVPYLSGALRDAFVAIGMHVLHPGQNANEYLDPMLQFCPNHLGPGARTLGTDRWSISSYGPDMGDDTGSMSTYPYTLLAIPYDPTNGTVSWGDIYRHSGKVPVNFIAGHHDAGGLTHGSNVNDTQGMGHPYTWSH